MNEINCIVMSLERGLTNQFLDIPPATESILRDLSGQGVVLGLSSANSLFFMETFLKDKRLNGVFSFLIGDSSAVYKNLQTGETKILSSLSLATVLDTASSLENLPVSCGVFYQNELVFDKPGVYALWYGLSHMEKIVTSGFSSIDPEARFAKILICGSKTLLQKIEGAFTVQNVKLLHPQKNVLEVVSDSTSMYEALKLAMFQFGLQPQHVLYFGQSDKDIPALEQTFGVCMKDSSPNVMKVSRRCTKYNAPQNGIGYMLNALRMEKLCVFKKPNREAEK